MSKRSKFLVFLGIFVAVFIIGYGGKGFYDAYTMADTLKKRADSIIAAGRGPQSLQPERLRALLMVQDPGFYGHNGVDFSTPGAGMTTLTQSLAKRLAFEKFVPGVAKIRQTGFALGLDRKLSKDQQIALFLDTAEMGRSRQGWVTGFHKASNVFFGAPPNQINQEQFYALVAVLIAPSALKLSRPDGKLLERIRRISRLVAGNCFPNNWRDVWLEGCR